PPKPDPRVKSEVIWDDPLVFMAAPEHPLAQEKQVTLAMLTGHSAILPSPVIFIRRIVENLFDKHRLTLNISMSTNYLETIYMMVSIGLGWSVLPATMLAGAVQALPVATALPQRQLGYVMHPARSLSNAGRHFLDVLQSDARM